MGQVLYNMKLGPASQIYLEQPITQDPKEVKPGNVSANLDLWSNTSKWATIANS